MVVTLLGKPGCHLCDDARDVVVGVLESMPTDARPSFEERSILDDPALAERYAELIPVVLVDGQEHAHWRVEPEALRAALAA